jgi:hypothetical protein
MAFKKHIYFTLLSLTFVSGLFSQNGKPKNLSDFDERPYHWGFILAYNTSSFYVDRAPSDYTFSDSLFAVTPEAVGAFAVGPIASLDLTPNIHIRSGITLAFQDRNLYYDFWRKDTLETIKKKINSVYTEIPLHIKLRTNRLNNYALYALGGIKYGYDWSSQIGVKETFDFEDVVKISRNNLAYSVGGGVDFFLPYFKFGIDLRLDVGINNVIIKNNTYFSNPIEKLRTRMFIISLTFEG